jgi:amino acid adenylation domain-containing protein
MNESIAKLTNTELSPEEKRELLGKLLQKKGDLSPSFEPLSQIQQGMWSIYQFAPKSWAYNVLFSAKILSSIDFPAFQKSWQILVDRHECLRTNYITKDDILLRQIYPTQQFNLEKIDTSTYNQKELDDRIAAIVRAPFDLETKPVFRVSLLSQSPTKHIFLLVIHHIAVDLWSVTILLDELRQIYQAQSTGSPLNLSPLKAQYTDYTRWQSQMLQEPRGEKLQKYWKNKLGGELPVLNLPTDRPRPPLQTFAGASYSFELDADITDRLKALARSEGASLYMVLLSAFKILLYRYSSQTDILVGSVAACRNGREFAGVVGACINPLVLRGDLTGNPTFTTLLMRVRDTVLEALQHQEYPFQLLTQQLKIAPDASRSPLFQVMFLLQKLHRSDDLSEFIVCSKSETNIDFGGLIMQPFPLAHQEGQSDLMLEAIETGESLKCIMKYNPLLFDASTIVRMTKHFRTLLEGIINNPQQSISSLPILTASERDLFVQWNDTKINYPRDLCVHQLFEKQAEKNPEAIAIISGKDRLTYKELNNRSNQLAHYLISLGVGAESLVGIYIERSLDMVIGMLGILKAGGAYLPLDSNYQLERLNYISNNAGIEILLTQSKLLNNLSQDKSVICLDKDWQEIDRQSKNNPNIKVKTHDLAYVIYTSGSTGKPKGVAIEHKALINFTQAAISLYKIQKSDRILQFASISFDAAVEEIYTCLTVGSTLVLRNEEMLSSAAKFLAQCQTWEITVLDLPTAYWHQLISSINEDRLSLPSSLRLVIIGGEKVLADKVAMWQKYVGNYPQLINTYGPTEGTVVTTAYPIIKNTLTSKEIPIGYPLGNVECFVLDPNLQALPIGVPGELYIGGGSLARGYLHQPELTAEKFISSPFNFYQNLYKTGDRVRYLPDGNLEFLGRVDNQVKIRGFRIELGEVEAVLSQHPEVKDVTVIVKENSSGDKCLVAYIVPQKEGITTIQNITDFVARRLPKYMIPAKYLLLEAFPLSPNGKIQHQSLPEPDFTRSTTTAEDFQPRNEIEKQLVEIWQKVLTIPAIGIKDDFFELGGNSLLTIRLITEIERSFSQQIPITTFLELSTIEKLAETINSNSALIAVESYTEPNTLNDFLQLTPKEKDLLLASTITKKRALGTKSLIMLEREGDLNQSHPLFFVYLLGDLSKHFPDKQTIYNLTVWTKVEKPETFVKAIATYYVKEIIALQPEGPYYLAGYCVGGLVALEIAKQLQERGQKVAHLSLVQTTSPDLIYQHYQTMILRFGYEYWLRFMVKWHEFKKTNNLSSKIGYLTDKIKLKFGLKNSLSSSISQPKASPKQSNTEIDYDVYETEVLKSLKAAMKHYHPEPYSGDVTLLFATEGTLVSFLYPDGGWSKLLTGNVNIHKMSGNHTQILRDPQALILAKKVVLPS